MRERDLSDAESGEYQGGYMSFNKSVACANEAHIFPADSDERYSFDIEASNDFQELRDPIDNNEESDINWPMSAEELKGECEQQSYIEGIVLKLPEPKELKVVLLGSRPRDKLSVQIGAVNITFFSTFLVKAEINPLLAIAEIFLTLIVIFSWFASVLNNATTWTRFVGGFALVSELMILHSWYGFVRYPSLSEGAGAMMSGEARDERFNATRDICSRFFYEDTARRSQTNALFFSAPFTIINHTAAFAASECLRVFGAPGGKKVNTVGVGPDDNRAHFVDEDRGNEGRDEVSALSQRLGFVVGNIVVLIFWVSGGVLSMTFAASNLWVNQSLYNSLLLRRSFSGFVLSLVVGDIFLLDGVCSDSALEAGILESDQEIRVETQKNQLKAKESGIENGTERTNFDVEQSQKEVRRPELLELVPISEDATTIITIVQNCNTPNVYPNKIEPKGKESDGLKAVPVKAAGTAQNSQAKTTNSKTLANTNSNLICRDTSAVVFGVDDEPGTQAWREVIKTSTHVFPSEKYSPGIHKWILHKLKDKKFYVKTSTKSQRQASRWEVKRRCKACFEEDMENWVRVQRLLGEICHQQDHEEHVDIQLHGNSEQRKRHMAPQLYTGESPSSTEKVEIDIATE